MHQFEVKLKGPIDLPASLEWFGRWGKDLLEPWDGRSLLRTVRMRNRSIPFQCVVSGTCARPAFRVTVRSERHAEAARGAVARMLISADGPLARLTETDPVITRLDRLFPGTRPVLQLDPFAALIRSISAQQVNLGWALTTRNRLAQAFGVKHRLGDGFVYSLDPRRLAAADWGQIRALQFTAAKSKSICALAHAILDNGFGFRDFPGLTDENVIDRLTGLPGIGVWTAEWYLARTLGRPRIVAGDLGVRKAVGQAYLNGRLPTEHEVRAVTAHWGAAAGVAQQLLLHALSREAL